MNPKIVQMVQFRDFIVALDEFGGLWKLSVVYNDVVISPILVKKQ